MGSAMEIRGVAGTVIATAIRAAAVAGRLAVVVDADPVNRASQ